MEQQIKKDILESSFAMRLANAFRLKLAAIEKSKVSSQGSFKFAKDCEPNSASRPKRKKIVCKVNSARRGASGSITVVDDDHVASDKGSTPQKFAENEEKDRLMPKHANHKHFGNFLRANS